MKKGLFILIAAFMATQLKAQSIEVMPGLENTFLDVQWLKPLQFNQQISVFNRTRATVDYENQTSLFNGTYLSFTTQKSIGISALGRFSNNTAGIGLGVHFFIATKSFMVFALASTEVDTEQRLVWFSISRFTPELYGRLKLYSSLELYSNFVVAGHMVSVQNLRLGLDLKGNQFGLGVNLVEYGQDWNSMVNPGFFYRKVF